MTKTISLSHRYKRNAHAHVINFIQTLSNKHALSNNFIQTVLYYRRNVVLNNSVNVVQNALRLSNVMQSDISLNAREQIQINLRSAFILGRFKVNGIVIDYVNNSKRKKEDSILDINRIRTETIQSRGHCSSGVLTLIQDRLWQARARHSFSGKNDRPA